MDRSDQVVDELETAVLASLREALEQKNSDDAAVAQAKGIFEAVNASAVKPEPITPPHRVLSVRPSPRTSQNHPSQPSQVR